MLCPIFEEIKSSTTVGLSGESKANCPFPFMAGTYTRANGQNFFKVFTGHVPGRQTGANMGLGGLTPRSFQNDCISVDTKWHLSCGWSSPTVTVATSSFSRSITSNTETTILV